MAKFSLEITKQNSKYGFIITNPKDNIISDRNNIAFDDVAISKGLEALNLLLVSELAHERQFITKDIIDSIQVIITLPVSVCDVDIGALMLRRQGREYALDITASDVALSNVNKIITGKVEKDIDTFFECKYDLTTADLTSPDLEATLFISNDEFKSMIFSVVVESNTYLFNVKQEK